MAEEGLFSALFKEGITPERVGELLAVVQPQDLSPLLEDLKPGERGKVFSCLPINVACEIAMRMHISPLVAALRRVPPAFCADVLSKLPSSRATDIVLHLKMEDRAAILPKLKEGVRKQVEGLMKYPAHTAGGIMSTEILKIQQTQTVQEAKAMVEPVADKKLHGMFVVDGEKLVGMVSMQRLAVSDPAKSIRDIVLTTIPTVTPLEDQELVAQKAIVNNWDFIGVISEDGRLLGGITLHDILNVVQHEASEDLHLMAGTKVIHPVQTPFFTRIKMRLPWLMITLFGELLVAFIISTLFRSTIENAVVLSAFIPAVIAVGGNVGLQSTTIVVRGLGTGVLKTRHIVKVLLNGVQEGFLLGFLCGLVAGGFAILLNMGHVSAFKLGISILLGMVAGCSATSLVGAAQPIVLYKRGLDPAIACGPAITLFNDLFGSVVYLTIAMLLNIQFI